MAFTAKVENFLTGKKSKSERCSIYFHCFTEQTQLCANCAYYYPHYLKNGFQLASGHCVYPRHKLRYAYDICENFQNKEDTKCK